MRKGFYLLILSLVLLCSCNSDMKEIQNFVNEFVNAAQQGNKEEMKKMYPDYTFTDSIVAPIVSADSLEITQNEEDNTFLVKMGNGIDMTITRDNNGIMTIKQSHGLFCYESSRQTLAMKMGQFKPELDDVTNAARMRDNRYLESLKDEVRSKIKSGLSARCVSSDIRSNFTVRYSIVVSNNNDFDIPGDVYQAKATNWGFNDEILDFVAVRSKICTGQPIPANGKVTYFIGNEDFEYSSWSCNGITVTDIPLDLLMTAYTPQGNEYDEFIKNNGEATTSNESPTTGDPLKFNMSGIMGGCGTQLTFNSTSGTLRYNPRGKKLTGNLEHRTVSLVSYNPDNGHLVLQVKNGSTTTGNLDGKLKNGGYSGRFRNVNGNSSPFSFK